jgi:hypothetical protein
MRKAIFTLAAFILSLQLFSAELVLIRTGTPEKTKELFSNRNLVVNYYNDLFAIASTSTASQDQILLDAQAWNDSEKLYYILYFDNLTRDNYLSEVSGVTDNLYQGDNYVVVAIRRSLCGKLYPAVHGGMVKISERASRLSQGDSQRANLSARAE